MIYQNISHLFFSLLILVISFGCQEKTVKEGMKRTETINEKKSTDVKPAVMYKSNDLGMNWSSFANGIPEDATLSGIKQEGNKVYVTTDYHGVFVASDAQDHWTSLNIEELKGLDINCIEVEGDKLLIGTLKNGVLISNDGGLNWKQSQNAFWNLPIRAFIKTEKKLYAGTDSGIFESVDMGDTWVHVFGQMQILGFTSLNDTIYAATQNGVLMCNGSASNWESIYEGDALHDIGNDGKYIYAMTIGQQLLKTKNDGALWENAQSGIPNPPNFYTNELQHIGTDVFSAQWIGIYHSSNNGDSWEILKGLPDSTAFSTLEITDFGIIAGISIR